MQVNLSRGYKAEVSRVDYRRVVLAGPWFTHVDSKKKTVYAERNVQKTDGTWTMQKLHRFIKNVSDPNVLVDHRDGNGLNNTRRNLRKVTASQSQQNRSKQSNNTTGISGVSWNTNAEKYEQAVNETRSQRRFMEWVLEYYTLGEWRLWKIVPSRQAGETCIANRQNPTAICRIRQRRKR